MYGRFIRQCRTIRGISQVELARMVGTSQSNISACEHGRRIPTADTLNKIVVACGFVLVAEGSGSRVVCGLPRAGWFDDDDLPENDELSDLIAEESHRETAEAGRAFMALSPSQQSAYLDDLNSHGDEAIQSGRVVSS
jgi:transcriptional regulator with XRE-family HTH domain